MQSSGESLQACVANVTSTVSKLSIHTEHSKKSGSSDAIPSEISGFSEEPSQPLISEDCECETGDVIIEGAEGVMGEGVTTEGGEGGKGAIAEAKPSAVSATQERTKRTILVLHDDIIGDSFWEEHPHIIGTQK